MIQYSILLPQRNATEALAHRLTDLCTVMAALGEPFELLCIDDHSTALERACLRRLHAENPCLRVIELKDSSGLDGALAAGVRQARGAVLIALEASDRYYFEEIPRFAERMHRADLVWGSRSRPRLLRWWRNLRNLPLTIISGSLVRDPDCLFWAARREVFTHLEFDPGWHRSLPEAVSERGFRVAELRVSHRWHARVPAINRRPWFAGQRDPGYAISDAIEMKQEESGAHRLEIIRFDPPQPLSSPGPTQPETPRDRHRTS